MTMTPDLNILVVDDEVDLRTSLKQALEELGKQYHHAIEVILAQTIQEAWALLKQRRIDAIFLDIGFSNSGLSGYELLKRLPGHLDRLYIVIHSGKDGRELERALASWHQKFLHPSLKSNFPFDDLLKKNDLNYGLPAKYRNIVGFIENRPLPIPLAHTLRTIEESQFSLGKLRAIESFLETSIKYLTAILVTDAIHRKTRIPLPRELSRTTEYGFGVWLGWLRALLEQEKLGSVNDFVPEIWQLFAENLINQETLFQFLNRFKDVRNSWTYDYASSHEDYYKDILQDVEQPFKKFKEKVRFLAHYPLLVIETKEPDEAKPEDIRYQAKILMGADSATKIFSAKSSKLSLQKGGVYLSSTLGELGEFLLLHPFVSFKYCHECRSNRVFMMGTTNGNKLKHVAPCNHDSADSKEDFQYLQKLITFSEVNDQLELTPKGLLPLADNDQRPEESGVSVLLDNVEPQSQLQKSQQELPKQLGKVHASDSPSLSASEFERAVFISYAWGSPDEEREAYVNHLDQTLQARGITIVRDKNVLPFKSRIKQFMERIGRGQCVIVIISDKYLKSRNCMFELVQIAKNGDFYNRIQPIILSDAIKIYDPVERADYVVYWEQEILRLNEKIKSITIGANIKSLQESLNNQGYFILNIDLS